MNLFSLYIKFSENKNVKYFIYLFFLLFFLIGISIFRDYGISTDELFQRNLGLFINRIGIMRILFMNELYNKTYKF